MKAPTIFKKMISTLLVATLFIGIIPEGTISFAGSTSSGTNTSVVRIRKGNTKSSSSKSDAYTEEFKTIFAITPYYLTDQTYLEKLSDKENGMVGENDKDPSPVEDGNILNKYILGKKGSSEAITKKDLVYTQGVELPDMWGYTTKAADKNGKNGTYTGAFADRDNKSGIQKEIQDSNTFIPLFANAESVLKGHEKENISKKTTLGNVNVKFTGFDNKIYGDRNEINLLDDIYPEYRTLLKNLFRVKTLL